MTEGGGGWRRVAEGEGSGGLRGSGGRWHHPATRAQIGVSRRSGDHLAVASRGEHCSAPLAHQRHLIAVAITTSIFE